MAGAVSQALFGAFTGTCAQGVGHLHFEELLHGLADDLPQEILVLGHERFQVGPCLGTLLLGHGVLPF